jgi:hypothetical protein
MAKFSRHDPRNKKRGRNKAQSLQRDIRIRHVDENEIDLDVVEEEAFEYDKEEAF